MAAPAAELNAQSVETTVSEARAGTRPGEHAQLAVDQVASAAGKGSLSDFADLLADATNAVRQIPDRGERERLSSVLRIYEDVRTIWEYQVTNPIGAFFDDESANGLLNELSGRYPAYRSFIEPHAVRANGGRTLYPTAETRQFLVAHAAGIVAGLTGAENAPSVLARTPVPAPPPPERAAAAVAPAAGVLQPKPGAEPAGSVSEAHQAASSGTAQAAAISPLAVAAQPPASAAAVGTLGSCESPIEVQTIESTSAGLAIRANGLLIARITKADTVRQEGFAGFSMLTVDLPGASLGSTRSRDEWQSGLFASMRIVRYRSGAECGLRIRLQPRAPAQWVTQSVPDGVLITRPAPPVRRAEEAAAADETAGRSGSIRVGGSYSRSQVEGAAAASSSQLQLAFAQDVPHLGTLRGFITHTLPRGSLGAPYRGLALSGVMIGPTVSDYALGDLTVSLGETGIAGGTSVGGLLMRGAGSSWLLPGRVGLQVFGGRAAESLLVRIPGETDVTSPLSQDRLYGAQINWALVNQKLGIAAGWVRSVPSGAQARDNLVQAIEANAGARSNLRIVLEESFTALENRRSGVAVTVEPRISRDRFSLGGYARFLSKGFTPPVASSFFAGLRRSYGLFASAAPAGRLSVNGSFGQSESFDFFDPERVGTLSQYRSGSAAYQFTSAWTSSADYSTSDVTTQQGSVLPADSGTTSVGLATTLHLGRSSTSIRASHDDTINRIAPSEGVVSRRLDVESFYFHQNTNELFAHGVFADSRRPDGTAAGADYFASFGMQQALKNRSNLRAELGVGVTPAGIAASRTRRSFVSLGYQNLASRNTPVGIQLSYEVLQIGHEPPRHAFFVMTTLAKNIEWGLHPVPLALFSDRAIPLKQSMRSESRYAWLRVVVFVDTNRNGRIDSGERGLPNVLLRIDGRSARTNESGELERKLNAGRYRVVLEPRGETLDYFIPEIAQNVTLAPLQRTEIAFGVQPGARINGRIIPQGELPKPSDVEGIRVTLSGSGIEREAVSDEQGEFRFGVVPVGDYTVAVDRSTLDRETALAGPAESRVKVVAGKDVFVGFTLRKATARERVLEQP